LLTPPIRTPGQLVRLVRV